MDRRVLVTGGAGYIGSHTVAALAADGRYEPVTLDNLSNGNRWAVLAGDFVEADLGDRAAVREALGRYRPEAVIHLAGSIAVAESVRDPLTCYRQNTANLVVLLDEALRAGVRKVIFSSMERP